MQPTGAPMSWNTSPSYHVPSAMMQNQSHAHEKDEFEDFDMMMSTSPPPGLTFNSYTSVDERSDISMFYNRYSAQQQPKMQQDSFSFNGTSASPPMPAPTNHTSLLSKQLDELLYSQAYPSPVTTNLHFSHSVGHMPSPSIHQNFLNIPSKTNEQEQFSPLMLEEDYKIALLSPTDISNTKPDWQINHSDPIPIRQQQQQHGRSGSFNNNSARVHPYTRHSSSSFVANIEMLSPRSPVVAMSIEQHLTQFSPHQHSAAQNVLRYKQAHPNTPIPASLITPELAEVQDGRGWCLIANCGIDRATQKANPHYDQSKDPSRKRLDHLYDHIRDKHFDCRPYRCPMHPCTQAFSREHDLKRHEKTHQAVSLPCDFCGKNYTRDDNLKRHIQIKHPGSASLPQMNHMNRPYPLPSATY